MKIAVYVGSFNPVHKSHIKVVNLIDIKDKINMLKFYESDNVIIDTKNNKCEYTYQILREIQIQYKNDKIYLIIGDDLLINFDKWKNIDEILKYIDMEVYNHIKRNNLYVN